MCKERNSVDQVYMCVKMVEWLLVVSSFLSFMLYHLNNVCIFQHTGCPFIIVSSYVLIWWCLFLFLEIFRLVTPAFNYTWPWNWIICQFHISSTNSFWKEEIGLIMFSQTCKYCFRIFSFYFWKCITDHRSNIQ